MAWVGRTSTDEHQDPRQSLVRQLGRSKSALPESWVIVCHFFDVESGRMELDKRGRGVNYERYDVPIPRDGGIADLLAEAKRKDRRFDVVICESTSRLARSMFESLAVERELDRSEVCVFASNEPITLSGGRAQQILQRRINQSVAEYEVLNMLELSWGGLCTHVREGYNIGKPLYGYKAKKIRHPNPSKAAKGITKTRLEPDGVRGEAVTLMAMWRHLEGLGFDTIAERLNTDLEKYPPPEPPGKERARKAWSKSSVAEILKNPKYTGYQVYNRRARRSRGGRNKPNPPEMWVWSPEPAHEPLIPKWMFDELNAKSRDRQGSRDGAGAKKDRRATRTYLFRRRVLCDCGRRMIGNPRHGRTYYRCHPENNNRGRPDKYEGHPATIYMREDLIIAAVDEFFSTRVFGEARHEIFVAELDQAGDEERQQREEQRQRLQRKVADIARKQDNVLRQVEDGDPADSFTQGLRNRYNDLESERCAVLATIAELDEKEAQEPAKPSRDSVGLLEALPRLKANLRRAPEGLLTRLFDLTQLTIQVHYKTGEATLKVTLPEEHISAVAEAASELEDEVPAGCIKTAGQSLCASCTCPRCDSNAHWTDFESAASADWATGADGVELYAISGGRVRGGCVSDNSPLRGAAALAPVRCSFRLSYPYQRQEDPGDRSGYRGPCAAARARRRG